MASRNQSAPQDSVTGGAGATTSKPDSQPGHPIAKATTGGHMTNLIAHNSVTRRYLKRGELIAKRRAEASLNESQEKSAKDCINDKVCRATSLGSLREYQESEVTEQKRNRIFYSKPRTDIGITCAGRQKMKLSSKPLI